VASLLQINITRRRLADSLRHGIGLLVWGCPITDWQTWESTPEVDLSGRSRLKSTWTFQVESDWRTSS